MSLLKESKDFILENHSKYTITQIAECTDESKKDIYNFVVRNKLNYLKARK